MQTKHLAVAAVGGCVVWASSSYFGATRQPLEFTKPALPPPASVDLRAGVSAAFLSMPVDIGPLGKRAEQALPEKLAILHDSLPDAACARRTTSIECNTAKLEGSITRTGAVEMEIAATTIKLIVPVKYELSVTGLGWTSHLTERKSGEARIPLTFAVTTAATGGLDVALREDPAAVEPPITLLKSSHKLTRLLDQRLKPVIKSTEDELRRVLAALPVKAAITRAWDVLAQPLELGRGSGLWLHGTPEYYTSGGFVSDQGRMSYRVAIVSRMSIAEAERIPAATGKRQPIPAQDAVAPTQSRVRMAVPIDMEALRQIAESTFVKPEAMESRADRYSEPVKVKVRATRIYPAMRQIGLELDLQVTTHKGFVHNGKLNLAGRPVLDVASGTVTLADVTFPTVANKTTTGLEQIGHGPGIPRLGTEPFASMFTTAAKLDVSRALTEALPRATHMLNQRIGDDLTVVARLGEAVPIALELARDGAWLLVDLTGDIMLTYDSATVAPTPASPAGMSDTSKDSAGKKGKPGKPSVDEKKAVAKKPAEQRT